ncbi:hypothetical protein C8D77_102238 [Mesorhizobium loti]|uniref:Uncharacterized protein n=1 Tax=Rhizobium loti TaxID=381 RepID=A0A8E3B599_RHILI|nr:hypothetical protein C8D77_102238 [Mesorhizobium loti]
MRPPIDCYRLSRLRAISRPNHARMPEKPAPHGNRFFAAPRMPARCAGLNTSHSCHPPISRSLAFGAIPPVTIA